MSRINVVVEEKQQGAPLKTAVHRPIDVLVLAQCRNFRCFPEKMKMLCFSF